MALGKKKDQPRAPQIDDEGTYNGQAVKVAKVNDDGSLDLLGIGPNLGKDGAGETHTNPNPAWFQNVSAGQFEPAGSADESDETPVAVV